MAFTTEKLHPGTRRVPWQVVVSLVDGYVYTCIVTAARPHRSRLRFCGVGGPDAQSAHPGFRQPLVASGPLK